MALPQGSGFRKSLSKRGAPTIAQSLTRQSAVGSNMLAIGKEFLKSIKKTFVFPIAIGT
jgi:hypothetical protein